MNFELTDTSKNLISYIGKDYCSNHDKKLTKNTLQILREFYDHLQDSEVFINKIDIEKNEITSKINNERDIPKPDDFSYIIASIRKVIKQISKYKSVYSFDLFGRKINIYFITSTLSQKVLHSYVHKILIWLYVITHYNIDTECSKQLSIYIYLTPLKKLLPTVENLQIDKDNVNTGFTTTCSRKSSIVIYREEEWFKVFIHETFHNLGLDFSDMNNNITKKLILKIFPVKSDVKLYEGYTDSWAKIINVILCSYLTDKDKTFSSFTNNVYSLLHIEITYSCFQMIKVLDFMRLSYFDMYSQSVNSKKRRESFYREKTSILAYYIINFIILNNYQAFFELCRDINVNLLQFDNKVEMQKIFCGFIKENYKTDELINRINCVTVQFLSFKNNKVNKDIEYLIQNMRKSICEIV